jgi:amylosucrase
MAAYMLYIDRFARDFRGLERRLPWLEELGIRLVHLMPFTPSPEGNSDGGYAVSDYLGIDPRLGKEGDLERTASLLHGRGMYLAADLVLNHSSDDHPWALAARRGEEKYRNYYYIFSGRTLPDLYEAAMPEVFPASAPGNFTRVPELDAALGGEAWAMTVFHDFQWDLNWSNPEVFLEMLAVVIGMGNRGVDLIRLDAVPYLWKRPGTICQNLEEAHGIVRLLKTAAGVVAPRLHFLAEAIVQPSEIVRYLDSGGHGGLERREECQLAYHASLMALLWEALATRKTTLLRLSFGRETRLAPGTAWLSYARCHDDIGLGFDDDLIREAGYDPTLHRRFLVDWYTGRFPGSMASGRPFMENPATGDARISGTCASLCGLERALAQGDTMEVELALRRIELLHALIASLVGIPMIFSGDELATTNDYAWEEQPHLAEDNRWMHRPSLDWRLALAAQRAAAGPPMAGGRPTDGHDGHEGRIYRWIAKCLALRRTIAAFAPDAPFEVLPTPQEILAVRRGPAAEGGSGALVVANFTGEERTAGLRPLLAGIGGPVVDALHEKQVPGPEQDLILPAYGVAWLVPASSLPSHGRIN